MRKEQEILKDFEALGWKVDKNDRVDLILANLICTKIHIWKTERIFQTIHHYITMQEHKLLNELFSLWGWL